LSQKKFNLPGDRSGENHVDGLWMGTRGGALIKYYFSTGSTGSAGPIVTAGGLVFIGATNDRHFRAFDSKTGKDLWVAKIERNANANPLTYRGKSGKQYVAVIATDSVVAFALLRDRSYFHELTRPEKSGLFPFNPAKAGGLAEPRPKGAVPRQTIPSGPRGYPGSVSRPY
jgi:PQQ enzyme repeat